MTSLPREDQYNPENPHHERLSSNASQGSIRPTVAEELKEKHSQVEAQIETIQINRDLARLPKTQEEVESEARRWWAITDLVRLNQVIWEHRKGENAPATEIEEDRKAREEYQREQREHRKRREEYENARNGKQAEGQEDQSSPFWPYEILPKYVESLGHGEWERDPIIQAFLERQRGRPRDPETVFETKEVVLALRTLRKLVGKQGVDALRGMIEQLIKSVSDPVPAKKPDDTTLEVLDAS